jgi:alpha-galactosidase
VTVELKAWIAFYKEHRRFLLSGDLVRMDGVGATVHLHGVVAPDRLRALFAFAPADSLYPDPAPRLTFRGLDPERAYRVRPVFVGSVPSGLRAPTWWGRPVKQATPHSPDRPHELTIPLDAGYPGAVFLGSALEHTGVAAPVVHPDQVVLIRIDAKERRTG